MESLQITTQDEQATDIPRGGLEACYEQPGIGTAINNSKTLSTVSLRNNVSFDNDDIGQDFAGGDLFNSTSPRPSCERSEKAKILRENRKENFEIAWEKGR